MAKFNIKIEETRAFTSVITIEADITEDELDNMLTELQHKEKLSTVDLSNIFKSNKRFEVVEESIDKNGELDFIEIPSIEEVEENE